MEDSSKQTSSKKSTSTGSPTEDRQDLLSPTREMRSAPSKNSTKPTASSIYAGQNRFLGKLSRKKIISFAAIAILVIGAGTTLAIRNITKNSDSSDPNIASETLPNETLQKLEVKDEAVETAAKVAIKGELEVNRSLTIAPSDRPDNARSGQIYFDNQESAFLYFDGQDFRRIATDSQLGAALSQTQTAIAASEGALTSQLTNTLSEQNAYIDSVVRSLQQASGDVTLLSGDGITVNGLQIVNSGVTRLQGTPNQILVSNNTGDITLSLPQDIHPGAEPTFSGINLGTALSVDSGGSGSTSINLQSGGIIYYDGQRFVTTDPPTDPGLCFVSGVTAANFVSCGTLDFGGVTSINSLQGAITVSNADASGSTITIHSANQSRSGLLTATNQNIGGLKTFTGGIQLTTGSHITSQGNLQIQQAAFSDLILGSSGGRILFQNVDCSAAGNGGKLTLDANGVLRCDADTGGDGVGVASVSASDTSITVDTSDGSNPKISVNTRSGGGLSTTPNGLGLLDSCVDGQILKFNTASSSWICADDNEAQPAEDCQGCVALQNETPGTAQEGHINITGTVISGGGITNGPLLLKNLTDTTEAFDLQNVAGDSLVQGNTANMTVTIGSLTSPSTSILSDVLPTGTTNYLSTGGHVVRDVTVSGNYAYIVADSYLYIADVSDPDTTPEQVFSGSMGSNLVNPEKAIVSGNYLYVLDAVNSSYSALRVFDISSPSNPVFVLSRNDMNRDVVDMVQNGNYLYVINRNSSSFSDSIIYVYDISTPEDPNQVNTHAIPGTTNWPTAIDVQGTNLYVTDRGVNQLHSFDISNPLDINPLDSVSTNSVPNDISVHGNYAYVLNQTSVTLQTFDISNPAAMSLLSTSQSGDIYPSPTAIEALAGRIYVATYNNGGDNSHGYFQMFSTSNPAQPSLVGSTPLVRRGTSLQVRNGIAYVGSNYPSSSNMQVLRVGSDVTTLQVHGNTSIGGSLDVENSLKARNGTFSGNLTASNITSLGTLQGQSIDSYSVGGTLAIGSTNASAISLNQNTTLASGRSLSVAGSTTITTDSATALKVSNSTNDNLLLVDASGMNVDIGSTNAPTENTDIGGSIPESGASGNINISSLPNSVAVSGNYAYVAASIVNKLTVVDISQASSPGVVSTVPAGGDARYVAVEGDRVYLMLRNGTVELYDVSNPASPSLLGSTSTSNATTSAQAVAVKDNYLYLSYVATNGTGYIDTIDMSNPVAPNLRSVRSIGGGSSKIRLTIYGNKLFAITEYTNGSGGLRILNITDPTVASLPMTNHNMAYRPSGGVAAFGDYVFVPVNSDATLKIFDVSGVSGSGTLTPAGSVPITTNPSDITIDTSGKYAYITDSSSNIIQVLNITDQITPQSLGVVDVSSGNSSAATVAVAASDGRAYTVNNSRSNLVITDLAGSAPRISLNQNTVLATGRTFTTHGETTVRTDSDAAFRVQDAAGSDVLRVDTESGRVIASGSFAVGSSVGASVNCDIGESLNNITVVGGIITGGTCGDGTGSGGGGSEIEFGPDNGILIPSVDTKLAGETLTIGTNNAALINLNQDTSIASGKTLSVQGDTSIATTSETALRVADADNKQYILIDTENGQVTIGTPTPEPEAPQSAGNFELPSSPSGTATLSGQAYDMLSRDNYTFISLDTANKLVVYDSSNPSSPNLVAELPLTKPERMTLNGDYLYVLTDAQIYVVNVSNPANPQLIATSNSFSFFGLYEAAAANDTVLYVMTDARQIISFNITNPAGITMWGSRSSAIGLNPTSYNIEGSGSYFFPIDNGGNFFRTYSGTNSINPNGAVSVTKPTAVAIYGDRAYVTTSSNHNSPGTLEVYDISTPTAVSKIGASISTGNRPIQVRVSADGSYLSVLSYNSSSAQLFDLENPDAPAVVGSIAVSSGPISISNPANQIAVTSATGSQLQIFALSAPEPPAPAEPTFGITLDSNTISSEGSLVRLQGDTTVRTDSESAFSVQQADGSDILKVDTINGEILASGTLVAEELEVTGATSLATLSVSGIASFQADIIVNGHIITGGDTPSATALGALGSGGSCQVSGNDTSGVITLVTGSGASSGLACDITFSSPYDQPPKPVISSAGSLGAPLGAYTEVSATKLTLGISESPAESETYVFNYWNPQ